MAITAAQVLKGESLNEGIKGRLNDTTDDVYSDALLLDFLSDGQIDFSAKTGVCQYQETKLGTGTDHRVNMETLLFQVLAPYAITHQHISLDFSPIHEAKAWGGPEAGTPTRWSVWGKYIIFDKVPSNGTILNIYYTYTPKRITSESSEIGVPDKWALALKAYVEMRCRARDRETGFLEFATNEYNNLVQMAAAINSAVISGGGYS